MKKKKPVDLEKIEAQIEREFSQVKPEIFKRRNRKLKWTSYTGQAQQAHWFDDEKNGWITPPKTALQRTKRSATADCDVLESLVFQYEEAIKKGKSTKEALGRVEATAQKAVEMGLWPEEKGKKNLWILWQAIEGGELARKALNPVIGGPSEDEMRPYIQAAQALVKENPIVVKLPFVQDILITVLRIQKYGDKTLDALDIWDSFLHKRPGGKILHSAEALKRVVKKVKEDKTFSEYDEDEELDAYGIVGKALGISDSFLKKATALKGRGPGRPKKGK